ncbi:MAG: hypothetical protein E2P02_28220 [Acidobacteria bacterium]|nr:MAG: hypothetical protein E2P02_28220 [Acidobacteriota bacterium]
MAIKVLPDEFAKDEERLRRFQREAKVLASLNHPNIAAIYGLEQSADTHYLVLELVPGETLAERIARGPIPVEEALEIANKIADALEEAHGQGIVHRDLKPANVKQTEDGKIKVLDYGLAKVFQETPEADSSMSPTLTRLRQGSGGQARDVTRVGVILGTAAYMSPEQAKGKKVDKRTDVWAFGVVVYEMLTGKRAFQGDDVSDTLAAVLRAEPDFGDLPSETPPAIGRVLKLCLSKDAKRRVHDIADVRLAMDGAFELASEESDPVVVSRRGLPWAAVAVFASLVTGLVVWSLMRSEPPEVTRFAYDFPASHQLRNGRRLITVSPDGRRFVYSTTDGLYLRSMDQLDARLLRGTGYFPRSVVFSPDGRSIAYFQGDQLKRLALSGGAPVVVCSTTSIPFGAHWAPDDTIFFSHADGILRVSANGGTPELVIPVVDGEVLDAPQLLPDGDTVLFSVMTGKGRLSDSWDDAEITAVSLTSGERTLLVEGGSEARYVSSGHLVYAFDDGLFAVAFDAKSLRVESGPVSMVEGVTLANYAVSDDGTLFFLSGGDGSNHRLAWVDRNGKVEVIEAIPPNNYGWPRLSPDGERVLVVADRDARIYDLVSGRESRLTTDAATSYVGWTPSGDEVAYTANRGDDGEQVWMQSADGSGAARQLTALDGLVHFDSWAPNGQTFSAHHHIGGTMNQLMVPFDGEAAEPETWLEHDHSDNAAVFSPDGRYVAYALRQTGQAEIYIRPFPGPGGQTTVWVGGGAAWAPTGELFYRRSSDYMMMVVEVTTDPVLTVGPPVELFTGSGIGGTRTDEYAVTADGQRFLMSTRWLPQGEVGSGGGGGPKIVVVLNWVEELKQRVPTN